jgi:hypothetical protein
VCTVNLDFGRSDIDLLRNTAQHCARLCGRKDRPVRC